MWYIDDGDFSTAGAERNPQKTEVIYNVNDLGAALLEWRIGHVQNMPKSPQSVLGASHWESLSDPDSSSRTSSVPRQTSFELCTNLFSCVRTRRRNLPPPRVWESAASITFCGCTVTRSCNEPFSRVLLKPSFCPSRVLQIPSHCLSYMLLNQSRCSSRISLNPSRRCGVSSSSSSSSTFPTIHTPPTSPSFLPQFVLHSCGSLHLFVDANHRSSSLPFSLALPSAVSGSRLTSIDSCHI